jgi:hypothetical protein
LCCFLFLGFFLSFFFLPLPFLQQFAYKVTNIRTVGEPTTIFLKRAPTVTFIDLGTTTTPSDPIETIYSKCASNDARISSACSCYLSTAIASTVTVTESAVTTALVDATVRASPYSCARL